MAWYIKLKYCENKNLTTSCSYLFFSLNVLVYDICSVFLVISCKLLSSYWSIATVVYMCAFYLSPWNGITSHVHVHVTNIHTCIYIHRGVEIVSQLPDILAYFQHPCPAPHILCIQLSFNLPDIH